MCSSKKIWPVNIALEQTIASGLTWTGHAKISHLHQGPTIDTEIYNVSKITGDKLKALRVAELMYE